MTVSIASVHAAIAAAVPNRAAIVQGERRLSYQQLAARAQLLAEYLDARGITLQRPRDQLKNWEAGQDFVAIYMQNCPEYLEAMLACYRARAVPFNVNYRYVGAELAYLFNDAKPRAVIYQAQYAPTLAKLLPELSSRLLLIQIADASRHPLLPGAVSYEEITAGVGRMSVPTTLSEDDLYCLYTGGTTGMPKAVLWRQADAIPAAMGGRGRDGQPLPDLAAYVARAKKSKGHAILPAPPFMHGAGLQVALAALLAGNTVVIQNAVARFDPHDVLQSIQEHRVSMALIIGDAFGRPLLDAAGVQDYDLSSLTTLFNSGAILSPETKAGLLARMPRLRIVDALGASETGPQAQYVHEQTESLAQERTFTLNAWTVILSEDRTAILPPGSGGTGWLASSGTVPLGYLGDPEKTAETFPIIDGKRYAVSGDRVRWKEDGRIEYFGRDSFTINSGGEKIFAEEVEQALKRHGDVADVIVAGRAHAHWGQEVVAIVQLKPGSQPERTALLAEAGRHIARYKLPKAFLFVDTVRRTASGKADIRWAKSLVEEAQ